MKQRYKRIALPLIAMILPAMMAAQTAPAAAEGVVRQHGSIVKIEGTDLTLKLDQGGQIVIHVQPATKLLRMPPGQKDMKAATPIQLTDLQAADRLLTSGGTAADGGLNARVIVAMKQADIAQQHQQELADWQKRSLGGLVKQVDAQTPAISLTVNNKPVQVKLTAKTTFKRYAPDSMRFEDAKTAKLEDIHPGDQLRAKGDKNDDGTEIAAEEIVAGNFRNISGLVTAVDATAGTITVQDLATKKPVTVKISADSQMKKLPQMAAQMLAMRLKGGAAGASGAPGGGQWQRPGGDAQQKPAAGAAPAQGQAPGGWQGGGAAGGGGWQQGGGGDAQRQRGGDLNQMLARLPAIALTDLQKGDAVMIVSTEGSATKPAEAVTLLAGVEPILTAAPSSVQSFLSPWSLAGAPGGDQ